LPCKVLCREAEKAYRQQGFWTFADKPDKNDSLIFQWQRHIAVLFAGCFAMSGTADFKKSTMPLTSPGPSFREAINLRQPPLFYSNRPLPWGDFSPRFPKEMC
jgi:hypothetical protein